MASLPAVRRESRVAHGGLVPRNLVELMELAQMAIKSGLLPASIKTPEQAALIAIKGRELGITFMQSFESLFVVYGRVGMDTKLMASLLKRAGHEYRVIERTPARAVIDLYLKGSLEPRRFEMTMEEAEAARWHMEYDKEKKEWRQKNTWRTMPARMLMYRCLSSAIRLLAPDCLFGMHTTDEIEDERPEPEVAERRVCESLTEADEQTVEAEVEELGPESPAEPGGDDQTQAKAPAPWAQDKAKAEQFMAKAAEYFGLSEGEILTALGVKLIEETTLTMHEAKAQIGAWLEGQLAERVRSQQEEATLAQGALV